MNKQFYLSVKSTIDKLAVDVARQVTAVYPSVVPIPQTLDTPTGSASTMTGDTPVITWSLIQLAPHSRDPLYHLSFAIGVRTTADPNGELMAELLSVVHDQLPVGFRFQIKDYSGATVSELPGETGTGFVRDITVEEQLYDGQAALRMASISALVVREL